MYRRRGVGALGRGEEGQYGEEKREGEVEVHFVGVRRVLVEGGDATDANFGFDVEGLGVVFKFTMSERRCTW